MNYYKVDCNWTDVHTYRYQCDMMSKLRYMKGAEEPTSSLNDKYLTMNRGKHKVICESTNRTIVTLPMEQSTRRH